MATNQQTKKQHFIPRFYLKYFSDNQGFLEIYDKKNNRLNKSRNYNAVGYEQFYYANETGVGDELSQEVERWLQPYEKFFSQEISKIIPKIVDMKPLVSDDKYVLSAFMSFLWLRSPQMRSSINEMSSDLMKQVVGFDPEFRVESPRFSNSHHIKMMVDNLGFGGKGFTSLFYAKKWKIYIAKGSKKFVTSDSPVVEWWLPPQTFYGTPFLERNNYFALTPEIYIELSEPRGSNKINRKTLFDNDADLIKFKNIIIVSHAEKYIYSSDKNLIVEIMEGRNRPGKTELQYVKEFVLPWKGHKTKSQKTVKL